MSTKALLRKEFQLLAADRLAFIVLIAMPLALMAFVMPTFRAALLTTGFDDANGAEQAVPGLSVMFAFFLVGTVGISFHHEFDWSTWNRVRAAGVPIRIMICAKLLPPFALIVAQQTTLLLIGNLLFDLKLREPVGLMLIVVATAVTVLAFAAMVVALTRSMEQVDVVQTVGTTVFAGLGGAFTPPGLLPGWAQSFSGLSPVYWSINGYRSLLLLDRGMEALARPIAVLGAMSGGFLLVAIVAFRRSPAGRT